jgi:hypothetical protein
MKKYLIIVLTLVFAFPSISSAQKVGLKTNALYWATSTPNIGVEVGMGDRFTFNLEGGYNPWTFNKSQDVNSKMKHFIVSPELRYWFCESFQGHFLGLHTGYLFYNVSGVNVPFLSKESAQNRYQGWMTGLGIAYGHTWILGERFNIEASIGLGYGYTNFDIYECKTCGKHIGTGDKHYLGPTKVAVNLIYMIK